MCLVRRALKRQAVVVILRFEDSYSMEMGLDNHLCEVQLVLRGVADLLVSAYFERRAVVRRKFACTRSEWFSILPDALFGHGFRPSCSFAWDVFCNCSADD